MDMNTIVPAPDAVHDAIEIAKRAAAHDVRWINALNKAWDRLNKPGWVWNGKTLVMVSSDRQNLYRVTAQGCQCKAFTDFGIPCLHRAARKVLINAMAEFTSKAEQALPRMSPGERAVEAWEELVVDADALEDRINRYAEMTEDEINADLY